MPGTIAFDPGQISIFIFSQQMREVWDKVARPDCLGSRAVMKQIKMRAIRLVAIQ